MNILDQIVEHKRKEVDASRQRVSVKDLEKRPDYSKPARSIRDAIRNGSGVIAEFKRRSPSKGVIHGNASVERITQGYVRAGASALSVLTDEKFFGGSNDDLAIARKNNACPILRKDFTIDEYQIIEARSIGADAILLIAAVLPPALSKTFAALAHSLGLEVLLEVHDQTELLDNLDVGADLIGVNNRNLKDFSVSIETSRRLAPLIPDNVIRISESGISSAAVIADLKKFGYEGFLIGENFMKERDPEIAAHAFIREIEFFNKR